MAAQPSTAFRFKERTKSNGGVTGYEALCRACKDCRHIVKQVQEPPVELIEVDFDLGSTGRILGVAVGLGK